MTDTPPPRRALATFLRRASPRADGKDAAVSSETAPMAAADATPAPPEDDLIASTPAAADEADPGEAAAPATDDPPPTLAPTSTHDEGDIPPPSQTPTGRIPETDVHAPQASAWEVSRLPVTSSATPTFARPRERAVSPRTSAWQWIALVALALLLALQILLADRARLAAVAQWRPLLTTLCAAARCALPAWREPAAFTMLDRDVRPASDQAGALRIQASFRNDARWAQAWPDLQLSLSDADGRVIGSRVFAPAEYLGHAPGAQETLGPGQSARIDFRVRDPAAGTAAFTFEFH